MIFADTGYLIALVSRLDQHHEVALRWTAHVSEPLVVTEFVLVETVNALSKASLRNRALDVVDAVRTDTHFIWVASTPEQLDRGVQRFRERMDKDWSLTDSLSFVVMKELNITKALAHDHHFEQAGFEALLRRDP